MLYVIKMLFCHSHFCWYKRRGKELLYFLLLCIFFNKLYILKFKMFYLLSGLKKNLKNTRQNCLCEH